MFLISAFVIENPITFLNFSGSKSITYLSSFTLPIIENLLGSPPHISNIMHIPSSKPIEIEFGSMPLSNLYFASVSTFNFLEVFLIDGG